MYVENIGLQKLCLLCVGKGVGMVAQRRILPGQIILEEKPLIIVPDEIYEGKCDNLRLLKG
jgi:hypothetical protein